MTFTVFMTMGSNRIYLLVGGVAPPPPPLLRYTTDVTKKINDGEDGSSLNVNTYSQAELTLLTLHSFSHLKRHDPISHSSQTILSSPHCTVNRGLWAEEQNRISKMR